MGGGAWEGVLWEGGAWEGVLWDGGAWEGLDVGIFDDMSLITYCMYERKVLMLKYFKLLL